MSQMIGHTRTGGVCGWTSLDSAQAMFDWRRQASPKVRRSHKAGGEKYIWGLIPLKAGRERV